MSGLEQTLRNLQMQIDNLAVTEKTWFNRMTDLEKRLAQAEGRIIYLERVSKVARSKVDAEDSPPFKVWRNY